MAHTSAEGLLSDDHLAKFKTLLNESTKRTLNVFIANNDVLSEDFESKRIRVATKVLDEYSRVKDLPPPPKASQILSKNPPDRLAATSDQPDSSHPDYEVLGGHPYPNAPGVVLSDDTTANDEMTPIQIQSLIQTLPPTKDEIERSKVSSGLVEYRKEAGLDERILPRSLIPVKPLKIHKPVWHPPWKLMRVISGHYGWVRSVAVDHSNEWFATGSADRTIKIWDLPTGSLKLTLTGHINCVRGIAISERHPYLFSVGEDKMVKCWDLESNKVIRGYHGHLSGVYCCTLHPSIDLLITGGRDSTARVWDIRTKAQVHVLGGHTNTIVDVKAQVTDPQVMTGSMDTTIRFWDLTAGKASATLTNHKKSIRSIVLHHSEYSFASASSDNIKQWALPEGRFMKNLSGHNAILNTLALNRDNVLVSGADNGSIYLWDWKSGYNFQQLQTVVQPGSLESEAGIFASTFDHSGCRLITCEADKTIKVWKEDDEATPESHPISWKPSREQTKY